MKIVIDIPESLYEGIKRRDGALETEYVCDELMKAVDNGTPLSKGHGRLIDADETISKICGSSCGCHLEECGHDKPCYSVTRIESAPTIIEADKEEE